MKGIPVCSVSVSHPLQSPRAISCWQQQKKPRFGHSPRASSSSCQFESSVRREKRERWSGETLNSAPAVCSPGEVWKFAVGKVFFIEFYF